MSIETNTQPYQAETEKNRRKIPVKFLGGTALAVAVAVVGPNIAKGPEMSGEQTVVVQPGDTLDDLANKYVDGGASHTGAVRVEAKSNPDNADVFENGQLDPGEELELPEKAE